MRLRILALWDNLRSSYWFVPALMAVGATALAYLLLAINDHLPELVGGKLQWLYGGGPEGARSMLSTIAGSVLGVAGTTFSITIACLTLASSQFGPRLLRTFRRDTGNQIVLGTFISTFVYCLLVLRTIRGTDDHRYVPDLAITVGVVLAVFSLVVLIYFIHHTAASIQVSTLLNSVERELNCTIEDVFPAQESGRELLVTNASHAAVGEACSIKARNSGYLLSIDYSALVNYARERDCVVHLHLKPGDFSLPDFTLASITPASACGGEIDPLHSAVYFGHERTPQHDPGHAFLQVAEIAVRALSPGINDPFTAIACLDKLTQSMALLASRQKPTDCLYDEENRLRVVTRPVQYEELVVSAFQFIRRAAADNREVLSHLATQLNALVARANEPDLRSALEKQLRQTQQDLQASAA